MTHEDAVRIARNGEGAVVGELKQLDAERIAAVELAERRALIIGALRDAIAEMKVLIEKAELI